MGKNELFSSDEMLLTKLHEIKHANLDNKVFEKVDSLIRYYIRNHEFTWKQKLLATNIIESVSGPKKTRAKYYLVAIATRKDAYIGITTNPQSRVRQLSLKEDQTLKLEFKRLIGDNKAQAVKVLNKVRKCVTKHKDTIDWYNLECLPIVKRFKVK